MLMSLQWSPSKMQALDAALPCALVPQQPKRGSADSQRSGGGDSAGTRSRRSSFALERASFDANRSSLEAFGPSTDTSSASLVSLELVQVGRLFTLYYLIP
jgi:hypothetical protein